MQFCGFFSPLETHNIHRRLLHISFGGFTVRLGSQLVSVNSQSTKLMHSVFLQVLHFSSWPRLSQITKDGIWDVTWGGCCLLSLCTSSRSWHAMEYRVSCQLSRVLSTRVASNEFKVSPVWLVAVVASHEWAFLNSATIQGPSTPHSTLMFSF